MGRSNSCIAVVVIKLLNNLCEYPSNICIRCIRIDFTPSEQIKSANTDADLEELRTDTDQILADTGRILQMALSARIWIICLSHWLHHGSARLNFAEETRAAAMLALCLNFVRSIIDRF